jgi:hypothetical protein
MAFEQIEVFVLLNRKEYFFLVRNVLVFTNTFFKLISAIANLFLKKNFR